ncbi:MAG: hypothetical protein CUN56_12120 [Phototrophicales bacterium]|nr:MAG: hypothetical protein CUN56_12120 [Phototrophicales bacterium]
MDHIVQRTLSDLTLWHDNYNQGDVEAIQRSIRQFGFNQTIRIHHNTVMAGNHTVKALQGMMDNQEDAPHGVSLLNGEWVIPCLDISHLSEVEAQAYAIADNRTADLAQVDEAQLAILLQQVKEEDDALMQASGYSNTDYEALLQSLDTPTPPDSFKVYDEDIETEYCCPKCGYEWSGNPR